MLTRPYKTTGEEISLLGFGAMRLPTLGSAAEIDYPRAKALIDEAYKAGVNYFDTAYVYHEGHSERFLGRALAEYPRESYYLATKLPLTQVSAEKSAASIFEEQLARCQTDYFDFYLFHSINEDNVAQIEKWDLWNLLDGYRKAGKIRHLGFSFHGGLDLLREVAPKYSWDFAQLMYNYMDVKRNNAQEEYDIVAQQGIPCIIMEPLRGGRLASLGEEANAMLKAAAPARSIASWAMRWLAEKDNVLTILSGMNAPEQLRDNVQALNESAPLSAPEQQALEKAIDLFLSYALVPCTACRYCVPCPAGVDIPELLALKNKHAISASSFNFRMDYKEFPEEHKASHCTACGACEKVCPQGLPIRQYMEDINKMAAEVE